MYCGMHGFNLERNERLMERSMRWHGGENTITSCLRGSIFPSSRSTTSHRVVHVLVSIPLNLWGFKIGTCISFVWNAFSWLNLRAEGWRKEEMRKFKISLQSTEPHPVHFVGNFVRLPRFRRRCQFDLPECYSVVWQCPKESAFFEQGTSRNISEHLPPSCTSAWQNVAWFWYHLSGAESEPSLLCFASHID